MLKKLHTVCTYIYLGQCSGSSPECVSFGPELEEGGVEGIEWSGWVVPCEVAVDVEDVLSHLLLPLLWYGPQCPLQVLYLE